MSSVRRFKDIGLVTDATTHVNQHTAWSNEYIDKVTNNVAKNQRSLVYHLSQLCSTNNHERPSFTLTRAKFNYIMQEPKSVDHLKRRQFLSWQRKV